MAWAVTLKIVDCAAMSTLLVGAKISSALLNPPGFVLTDANGQAIIFDPNDVWEWVNVTISKAGTGGVPSDPGYHPGYVNKNFIVHMDMDGTIQTICLNAAPIPDPNSSTGVSCFVVTATTGSPASLEVNSLRALRDRVSATSWLGARLVDAVYDEYARFSPAIAAELYHDATARGTVLASIVRPLFAWYTLAGTLGFEGDDRHACRQAAQDVVDACPPDLDGRAIVGLLEALRSGAPLPPALPPMLLGLASQVADFRFASWAILEPLIRAWRSATDDLDVVEEVAQWLAGAPLERLARPVDAASLEAELAVVADFLAFAPSKRTVVGERLLSAWPDAAGALQRAGFIRQTVRAGECQSS
jgi:hypothetical protein